MDGLMSKNTKFAWSLEGLGAGVCCIIAILQAGSLLEKTNLVALFILGSLFFTFGAYGLGWFRAPVAIGRIPRVIMLLLIIWGGMGCLTYRMWPAECSITVDVNSTITASVHLRAPWLPTGQTEVYKPLFQDLFHEWVIKIVPNKETLQIIVSIRDARLSADLISVDPSENAIISQAKPGWASGFEESTQTPDFFARTVVFSKLAKPATITIRKPIKSKLGENKITSIDLDLDREISASAEKCGIAMTSPPKSPRPLSDSPRFKDLIQELHAMIVETVSGKPGPPTRLDPDEPYPPLAVNESELVEELRCKTPACSEMIVTMKEKTRVN